MATLKNFRKKKEARQKFVEDQQKRYEEYLSIRSVKLNPIAKAVRMALGKY